MMKLSDEILNKYIDGELDYASLQHVNEILAASVEDRKKLKALLAIHNQLKAIKPDHVSDGFTDLLMKRLLSRRKALKEQKNFVLVISSVFIAALLVVIGLVIYSALSQGTDSQSSTNYSKYLIDFFQKLTSLIAQMFTGKGMSIFGSILSLGVLISGYFFFESIKASKQNFSK